VLRECSLTAYGLLKAARGLLPADLTCVDFKELIANTTLRGFLAHPASRAAQSITSDWGTRAETTCWTFYPLCGDMAFEASVPQALHAATLWREVIGSVIAREAWEKIFGCVILQPRNLSVGLLHVSRQAFLQL